MKTKVYTIASGKGGTGKTTTVINLGVALAALYSRYFERAKVIMVDADVGMANMGLALGLEECLPTLHEVLAGKANVKGAIYDGPSGVKVVPSGISLQGSQISFKRFPDVVKQLRKVADFVLIDAPPGMSKECMAPLRVADGIFLVVNPDLASVVDALKIKTLAERYDRGVEGAIINRVGNRSELSVEKVEELLDLDILQVVPEDSKVRKASMLRVPVVSDAPNSPAAKAFKRLATSLFEERFGNVETPSGLQLFQFFKLEQLEEKSFVEKLKDLFVRRS
ncbi:MAG: cell division ATPase MinD [Methanocellales archaeon]|nr:cell division ATPase MinD [Methanocellales archaeon]